LFKAIAQLSLSMSQRSNSFLQEAQELLYRRPSSKQMGKY